MTKKFLKFLQTESSNLEQAGLYKTESVVCITSGSQIRRNSFDGKDQEVINFCSSNYLGLANQPFLKILARKAIDSYGFGGSSGRMVCGTQEAHKELENWISSYLDTEETMILNSPYEAHIGLYEALFESDDAIFSDSLCHPSIRDGIRLSPASGIIYHNNDLDDLEDKLKRSRYSRFRLIVTEGIFAINGIPADLATITRLAAKYDAIVVVDDTEGLGVIGSTGRGSLQAQNVANKVDLVTGSLGHLFGGVPGGFISGKSQIIRWLKQKSKPYLFSNALSPAIASILSQLIEKLTDDLKPLEKLNENRQLFGEHLANQGYQVLGYDHPIIAIRVGNAVTAQRITNQLFNEKIYTMGFCYPLLPKGEALIRVQITANHTPTAIKKVLKIFETTFTQHQVPRYE